MGNCLLAGDLYVSWSRSRIFQDLSRLFFHILANEYRPNPTNINMSNDIPKATNAASHSPVPEGLIKSWAVYAMNPTANAMILHTSKTGGKLRTMACPCKPKVPWWALCKYVNDCDCLTLVWCLQRQKTPVIMLPNEENTETMPAALEIGWMSGTASRPTVADNSTVAMRRKSWYSLTI